MIELRAVSGVAARVLEFLILTATRTGETIGAKWSEVDIDAAVWVVPPERMRAKKEHRIPLSKSAMSIIKQMKRFLDDEDDGADNYIFWTSKPDKPLSNMAMLEVIRRMGREALTVHGFRSCFRDWVSEATNHPSEVAEIALAHVVPNKVEAAYRRGDLFEKRRKLMDDWAEYCLQHKKEKARRHGQAHT